MFLGWRIGDWWLGLAVRLSRAVCLVLGLAACLAAYLTGAPGACPVGADRGVWVACGGWNWGVSEVVQFPGAV